MLLTLDAFLPLVKEASSASNVSPPASSSSLKKKSSKSKEKKKALMKAFLDSLNVSSEEDEEVSKTSSKATIDPQMDLFGNSGFATQYYFPGLEDL
jgi:hypothetical protein